MIAENHATPKGISASAADIEQEIASLVARRRTGMFLQSIAFFALIVGGLVGWTGLAAAAVLVFVIGVIAGKFSWWLFLRGYRSPLLNRLSLEEVAREEVLAKYGMPK